VISHAIERRGSALAVTLELELGDALSFVPADREAYERRLRQYLDKVCSDTLEVLEILAGSADHGVVKWFDDVKGYGFIRNYSGQEFFVHWRGIAGEGYRTLASGQRVTFKTRQGRESIEAIEVRVAKEDPHVEAVGDGTGGGLAG
jgi:CspA family cold shock protein